MMKSQRHLVFSFALVILFRALFECSAIDMLPTLFRQQSIPPSPGYPPCSVCGEGLAITLPDVILTIPGQAPTSCANFELGGQQGFVDPQFCPLLPGFAAPCGCTPVPMTAAPTATLGPAGPQTTSSPPSSPPSSRVSSPCPVCGGAGLSVTTPDVVVKFPGQSPVTCETLELAGEQGLLDSQLCPYLPVFAHLFCGCGARPPVASPSTASPSTEAPASTTTPIPPSPGFPPCSVCGDGLEVTRPDAIVTIPGQSPTNCAVFEQAGLQGFVDPQFCPLLSAFAGPCGCAPISPVASPSTASPFTEAPATIAPVLPPTPPNPGHPPCSVCGDGLEVTRPDAIVTIPSQGSTNCAVFEQAGLQGFIDPQFCPLLPAFAGPCGCMTVPL